jgi:hypothetical protein
MMTAPQVIGELKEIYLEYFGVPHSNKAYAEQSRSIKALVSAVGEDNLLENFRYLLACEDAWLQNAKNIPGLIKWFDAIQTMRMNNSRTSRSGSFSAVKKEQEEREQLRLAKFKKEMLHD